MGLRARRNGAIHGKEREQMRAGLRLAIAILAAGLWLGPAAALAQSAPAPTTNTPRDRNVGPRELQNFSLEGTVTRPAEPRRASAPARRRRADAGANRPHRRRAPAAGTDRAARSRRTARAGPRRLKPPARSPATAAAASAHWPRSRSRERHPSTPDAASRRRGGEARPRAQDSAVAVAACRARARRRRGVPVVAQSYAPAYAGGPQIDAFVTPEPAPHAAALRPTRRRHSSPRPPPGRPTGVVSTSLRPWIEIIQPLGCIVDDDQITVEFNSSCSTSGSAPARAMLVEASMFNAGPSQEQDIAAFFANPAGAGRSNRGVPPLQRMTSAARSIAPRANVQRVRIGGRQVFVPLLAFNALYGWSGGEGQTSVSYLLGRETKGDKLAPLRLDLGPRAFTRPRRPAASDRRAQVTSKAPRIVAVPGEHGRGAAIGPPRLGQLAQLLLAGLVGKPQQPAELDHDREVARREDVGPPSANSR